MAKIFKISGYLADPNGLYSKEEIENELDNLSDLFGKHIQVIESEEFEWEDELLINYSDVDKEICEAYFKEEEKLK